MAKHMTEEETGGHEAAHSLAKIAIEQAKVARLARREKRKARFEEVEARRTAALRDQHTTVPVSVALDVGAVVTNSDLMAEIRALRCSVEYIKELICDNKED